MATIKPIGLRTDGVFKVIDPNTDELDAKILVSQPGVVLGRVTAGAGPHEEILFGDLPGGGSYIEVTYAEMQILLNGATLQKGSFYKITDASGTDLGFVTTAVEDNQINVAGVGGYLNADFQNVGDYSGVEAITGVTPTTNIGIWRLSFEEFQIPYTNLSPDYITYSIFEFQDSETYLTNLGNTGTILTDDAAGNIVLVPNQQLSIGEIIVGDTSLNRINILTSVDPTVTYSITSGPLTNGETYTTDLANTGTILVDDTFGTVTLIPDAPLSLGEIITGDSSTNSVTVDTFTDGSVTYDPTLQVGETYTTDLGNTGTIILDDDLGTITLTPDQPLSAGEILTGDTSLSIVTIDSFVDLGFNIGDTITDTNTGATAIITANDGSTLTVYSTSPGLIFNDTDPIDNGAGTTATIDGPPTTPSILLGDVVIWNLIHYQLTDAAQMDGNNPADNTSAYTQLLKTDADQGYIETWDVSEFDFPNNQIGYRQDLLGGLVRGATAVASYQFGRDACTGNNIQSPDAFDIRNLVASFNNNTTYPGAVVSDIVTGIDTTIRNNIVENAAQMTDITAGSNCNITDNRIGKNAVFRNTIMADNCSIRDCEILGAFENMTLDDSTISGNFIYPNASIRDSTFIRTTCSNNCLFSGTSINNIVTGIETAIEKNIIENGGQLTGIVAGENCSISRNKIGQEATLGDSTTMGDGAKINDNTIPSTFRIGKNCIIGLAAEISNNTNTEVIETTLGASAAIRYNNVPEGIAFCVLGENAYIVRCAAAYFSEVTLEDNAYFENVLFPASYLELVTLSAGNHLFQCIFENTYISTDTISETFEFLAAKIGFSNIPGTIDITGLITLDCTAAWAQYRGIFNLTSSNATESLDTIQNFPILFPFKLYPASGLTLTITGTAIGGIGAGQIALPVASIVLNGTNGEWIELEPDSTNTYLKYKNSLSGVI